MRPATIANMKVDGLKPARLLVVALLTFVLIVSASVVPAAGRVALVGANSSYAYMPPPAAGFGVAVAMAAQEPSAVEAELGLNRPTRRLIQQGLRNEGPPPTFRFDRIRGIGQLAFRPREVSTCRERQGGNRFKGIQ